MSKDLILGIDTSNYTTSVALLDENGKLLAQKKRKLKVKKGNRGLRQSKAVFQHVNQLPEVINEVVANRQQELAKIVVSTKPRSKEGSYMPVFRVGQGQARTLAHALDIPLIKVSHQAGHLMAGLWSNDIELDHFLALHLSGGTSELLLVKQRDDLEFEIEEIGGSQDITAGQFVDRVGVKLGLSFPAGQELEKLAKKSEEAVKLPYSVQGLKMSFSGPATAAMRKIEARAKKEDIALGVQEVIANSLINLLAKAIEEYDCQNLLLVGGVMANQYLRDELKKELSDQNEAKVYFANPKWSSDNAVGVAALGINHH